MFSGHQLRTIRRAATVGLSAALLTTAPALRAQTPQGGAAPPTAGQAEPATLQLSMQQAEDMALETNLGLKANRLSTDIASENLAQARAAFAPIIASSFQRNSRTQQPLDFTQGSATISSNTLSGVAGLRQSLPWLGQSYSVNWSNNRTVQVGGNSTFNPNLGSTFSVNFTQPLLRNFLLDGNRANVSSNELQRQITDLNLQQQILQTKASVDSAYLGLIAARAGLDVAQQNMDLAQENLKDSIARVKVGAGAQIDTIQAEALVASNQEQVIVAEANITAAEDNLRTLIVDPARPDYWQVRLLPTDKLEATPRTIDVDAAVQNALASRLDLLAARRGLDQADLQLRFNEDQKRPQLDFNLGYSATTVGGTELVFGSGFPPPIVSSTTKSFGSVLGDTFRGTYPNWSANLAFSYPIGTSAASAAVVAAQLQKQQQALSIKNLELQVAAQVRQAARNVETSRKRVEATQKAQEATQQQLDAEKRKFEVGLSNQFTIQQFEIQLSAANVNKLNALIALNQSLIDFDRVQKIR